MAKGFKCGTVANKGYTDKEITDRVIYGKGKNLLKNTAKSQTIRGVTFTVNSDGSVTANGTATDDACYYTINNSMQIPAGDYILTGCPSGGERGKYILYCQTGSGSTTVDTGDGVSLHINDNETYSIIIRVYSGQTINNQKFYPMIRLASETDDTYEPYYEGLAELTDRGMELLWENASPSSSFPPQNIKLDIAEGDLLLIMYRTDEYGERFSVIIRVFDSSWILQGVFGGMYETTRKVGIAAGALDTLRFEAGYIMMTYAKKDEDNKKCFPIYIYKLKGASA